MKGQLEFVTSYMGPWWAGGLGGAWEQALLNFLKFQPHSPIHSIVTQLAVHDYDFLHQDHSGYSYDHTPVTIVCFEIWKLIMMVFAVLDDEWLEPLSMTLEIGSMLCSVTS